MTDDFREYTGRGDIGAGKELLTEVHGIFAHKEPPTAVHGIFAHKKYLFELYC